jgi:hypothetical protein
LGDSSTGCDSSSIGSKQSHSKGNDRVRVSRCVLSIACNTMPKEVTPRYRPYLITSLLEQYNV